MRFIYQVRHNTQHTRSHFGSSLGLSRPGLKPKQSWLKQDIGSKPPDEQQTRPLQRAPRTPSFRKGQWARAAKDVEMERVAAATVETADDAKVVAAAATLATKVATVATTSGRRRLPNRSARGRRHGSAALAAIGRTKLGAARRRGPRPAGPLSPSVKRVQAVATRWPARRSSTSTTWSRPLHRTLSLADRREHRAVHQRSDLLGLAKVANGAAAGGRKAATTPAEAEAATAAGGQATAAGSGLAAATTTTAAASGR